MVSEQTLMQEIAEMQKSVHYLQMRVKGDSDICTQYCQWFWWNEKRFRVEREYVKDCRSTSRHSTRR